MENAKVLTNLEKQEQNYKTVENYKNINLERLGETVFQNCGEVAYIVEYNSSTDITIIFHKTKERINCTYGAFKQGVVKSHFSPSVYNVGIVGREKIKDENGKVLNSYSCWTSMLNRCYNPLSIEKFPTYNDCTVCEDWKYFSNFKKWYNENFYSVGDERMNLDKDILFKGNRVYSPETCIFVPRDINTLILQRKKLRGDLPIGVREDKRTGRFEARCNVGILNKDITRKCIGYFEAPIQAFNAYKVFKEQFIKDVADKYKGKIPEKLYDALYEYKIDIMD